MATLSPTTNVLEKAVWVTVVCVALLARLDEENLQSDPQL
jgi:hypothetical protein